MAYHPRIETADKATFITTRTRNCEMWFANNPAVEQASLAILAKTTERYKAKLYAFGLVGSHYHAPMLFPLENRSEFARDFNSGVACAVARYTPNYKGGRLFARRYSGETIAGPEDIERQFFYTVLQPIHHGLVDKISEYRGYNCFHDAVCGITRKFKLVNWAAYNAAKRYNSEVKIKDFVQTYKLKYERLPGYEHLSQHEYKVLMNHKLEEYRQEILRERAACGKTSFMGSKAMAKIVPGTPAKNPKVSNIKSHRPRVLSRCSKRLAEGLAWYFDIFYRFKEASKRYLAGELEVEFPPGTFRPPMWLVVRPTGPYSPI